MSKQIILHGGHIAHVDEADYAVLSRYKWYLSSNGYAVTKREYKFLYMHRVILGAQKGQIVDHRDRNRLNNTRANLRFVTRSENAQNSATKRTSKTGFKNVSVMRGKFHVCITKNGQERHFGSYSDIRTAALVADAATLALFGSEAKTNLNPDEITPDIQQIVDGYLNPPAPVEKRSSRYRGCYWHRGRWRVKIGVAGKSLHLGTFRDEDAAARCYDANAKLLYGDKAKLNFPGEYSQHSAAEEERYRVAHLSY